MLIVFELWYILKCIKSPRYQNYFKDFNAKYELIKQHRAVYAEQSEFDLSHKSSF